MNVLLMLGMMALAMIFFHGRGHQQPSPEPNHRPARPAVASQPSPETLTAPRNLGGPPSTEPKTHTANASVTNSPAPTTPSHEPETE